MGVKTADKSKFPRIPTMHSFTHTRQQF